MVCGCPSLSALVCPRVLPRSVPFPQCALAVCPSLSRALGRKGLTSPTLQDPVFEGAPPFLRLFRVLVPYFPSSGPSSSTRSDSSDFLECGVLGLQSLQSAPLRRSVQLRALPGLFLRAIAFVDRPFILI